MQDTLNGATRVHFIVGDPIAQVKSPAGVTEAYQERGHNAMVMPAHVAPSDLAAWLAGVSLAKNVDGIIVTVPHKFACFDLCATASDSARFLHTVNTMRRNANGTWHGDMFDGLGFVQATARPENGLALSRPLRFELEQPLLAPQGGAGGFYCVIGDCLGCTPECHDRIADVLVDRTALFCDNAAHLAQIISKQFDQLFGFQAF